MTVEQATPKEERFAQVVQEPLPSTLQKLSRKLLNEVPTGLYCQKHRRHIEVNMHNCPDYQGIRERTVVRTCNVGVRGRPPLVTFEVCTRFCSSCLHSINEKDRSRRVT